jgi:hypothetical protein
VLLSATSAMAFWALKPFQDRDYRKVSTMEETTKISAEELEFVKKYCLSGLYPASDERCLYTKVKMLAAYFQNTTVSGGLKKPDAIFLCRYPDEKMPTHEASLISELEQCPYPERRKKIDALDEEQV